MPPYRSRTTTHGRNMAGARGLWRATGMKNEDFGKPIIAVVNSFTQFVPGHVHLQNLGQLVAREIEKGGGVAKEFNTIAVDDGIAMGHDGMLYSLPSRELIADSVEYMVNAHCADAMVCISNCDKITPGMLMAAMRLNIPAVFVSGGPMEAGKYIAATGEAKAVDLIDAMVAAADERYSDEEVKVIERSACPTCGSCSGMFTANSMNCLTEALGLSLPRKGGLFSFKRGLRFLIEMLAVKLRRHAHELRQDGPQHDPCQERPQHHAHVGAHGGREHAHRAPRQRGQHRAPDRARACVPEPRSRGPALRLPRLRQQHRLAERVRDVHHEGVDGRRRVGRVRGAGERDG